jgi:hypothetical protein
MKMNELIKDIPVVVQGPYLEELTLESIASLRKVFPKNVILFATWKNANSALI